MIFFRENMSRVQGRVGVHPLSQLNNGDSCRDISRSPQVDTQKECREENENGDKLLDSNDEGEATDMNLVKHLCSTVVDEVTGLPIQKITAMCGHTGKRDRMYIAQCNFSS